MRPRTEEAASAAPVRIEPGSGQFEVFADPRSVALLAHLARIAPSDACVLIRGETGSGQNHYAQRIHEASPRRAQIYLSVNCGAYVPSDLERELFGCEKGALPGAFATTRGWIEAAHRGTLFIDEIDKLPLPLQARLLQWLQTGEVTRVGSRTPQRIDVRLVAATAVDLHQAVRNQLFRTDLCDALQVAPVDVPPLRERPGDILPLAQHFIAHYRARMGYGHADLSAAAVARLLAHAWPGNVRELENVIHHALLLSRHGVIAADQLNLVDPVTERPAQASSSAGAATLRELDDMLRRVCRECPVKHLHDVVDRSLVQAAFEQCGGHQGRAAALLGLSRNILRARLIKYQLINARK